MKTEREKLKAEYRDAVMSGDMKRANRIADELMRGVYQR